MDFSIENYNIPSKPGCYIYKNKSDEIIYVGKAKNLKKRVSSYFNKNNQDIKTRHLVRRISHVEFIITNSEVEALILENTLIKKHSPKYNIMLKDSKTYPYILITDEKFPRLLITRKKKLKGKYFGPFPHGDIRRKIVNLLIEKFKLRTCKKLPKKACLRYQIDLCDAPCENKISEKEYSERISEIEKYIKGNDRDLILDLEKKIKKYSENLEFEKAQFVKEQIETIYSLREKQLIEQEKKQKEDVINYVINKSKVDVVVFYVRDGLLQGKDNFKIDNKEGFLDDFIKAYYGDKSSGDMPYRILIPKELEDESISDFLNHIAQRKVELRVPKKGDKKDLLDLAKKNIEVKYKETELQKLDIMEKLNLDYPPRTIECFDISHIQGSDMVASMVHFKDGKPDKKNYRRFKIRSLDAKVDDFRAMEEVVYRRYSRLLKENKDLPDLIVIDGGLIQLKFSYNVLKKLNLDVPIVGLAKKFEEIYVPNKKEPFRFDKNSPMMKLLIQIRDETHRFGIKYHRLLRKKRILKDD